MLTSSIQVANWDWDGNRAHRASYLKYVRLSVTSLGQNALRIMQGAKPVIASRELAWSVYCSTKVASAPSNMGPFSVGGVAGGPAVANNSYSLPQPLLCLHGRLRDPAAPCCLPGAHRLRLTRGSCIEAVPATVQRPC